MIRSFLLTKPHLYDLIKRAYRIRSRTAAYQFLDSFSRLRNRRITFVQIGASDGMRCDPIREFVIRDRWKGCLVEPLPTIFPFLKENYDYQHRPDLIFVNAAVSSSSGRLSFWTFDEDFLEQLSLEARINYSQKSSFEKEHVLKWIRENNDPPDILKEITVPCFTLSELITHYLGTEQVDLLVIDAEGHEPSILHGIDFDRHTPTAIFYESHNLGTNKRLIEEFLRKHKYVVSDLGGDSVAVYSVRSLESACAPIK